MLELDKGSYQLVIAGAPGMDKLFYKPYLSESVSIVFEDTYNLLSHSEAAIVCSGTATLETALFNVPQVCGYKAGWLSYLIAKWLVKIPYISLVNLCLGKKCITELIQGELNVTNLESELRAILPEGKSHIAMMEDYITLKKELGEAGASRKAAELVVGL